MGPFLDSIFERFVRLELLHVCGNEVDYGMVRTTKRSSWNCMKGIWNGTVTMIKCLVISCRTFHMFVLREGFSQVCVVEVTAGWYYAIWVSIFSHGDAGSEVVDCCSCIGLGRYVDTNKNNRGKLAWRVEGSASDSQSFKFWRTGGGENISIAAPSLVDEKANERTDHPSICSTDRVICPLGRVCSREVEQLSQGWMGQATFP